MLESLPSLQRYVFQAETAELRDILDDLRTELAKKHNTKAKIIFTDVQLENLARAVRILGSKPCMSDADTFGQKPVTEEHGHGIYL